MTTVAELLNYLEDMELDAEVLLRVPDVFGGDEVVWERVIAFTCCRDEMNQADDIQEEGAPYGIDDDTHEPLSGDDVFITVGDKKRRCYADY